MPLRNLIRFAYELRNRSDIKGGPEWMDGAAFDILAQGAAHESQPSMMRGLLTERFKLAGPPVRGDALSHAWYGPT